MEQNEYRKHHRWTSTRRWGYGVGGAVGAYIPVYDALADIPLPEPGSMTYTGSAAALAVGAGAHGVIRWRGSETYGRRKRRRARHGWTTKNDLKNGLGAAAARKHGAITRPSLQAQTTGEQLRRMGTRGSAHITEYGVPLGTIRTGGPSVRGRTVVANWEQNLLCFGAPGTGKSTFLSGVAGRVPGAAVVISTKDEFVRSSARLRQLRRGPVRIWDLRGVDAEPQLRDQLTGDARFRWNLVRGCGDPSEAQRRAAALVSTVGSNGENAEMWQQKSQNAIAALLVAAARDGKGIAEIARWVTTESYKRPVEILERFGDLPEQLVSTIRELSGSRAEKTSGSVAQTASTCFGFLTSQALVDEMSPAEEDETDLEQLIKDRGTLYVIADRTGTTRPAVAAVLDEARRAAERVSARSGKRLDPPMSVVADECQTSLRGVPIDEWAAEMRSTGVWMCFALQDRAQLEEAWGEKKAKAIEATLHHTIVTGAPQEQREHYADRVGKRTETHVTDSHSKPDSLKARLFPDFLRIGYTRQESTSTTQVRVMEPTDVGHLSKSGSREALLLPSQGAPCVLEFPKNWQQLADETKKAEQQERDTDHSTGPEETAADTARPEGQEGPRLRVVPDDESEEGAA